MIKWKKWLNTSKLKQKKTTKYPKVVGGLSRFLLTQTNLFVIIIIKFVLHHVVAIILVQA